MEGNLSTFNLIKILYEVYFQNIDVVILGKIRKLIDYRARGGCMQTTKLLPTIYAFIFRNVTNNKMFFLSSTSVLCIRLEFDRFTRRFMNQKTRIDQDRLRKKSLPKVFC